MNRFLFMLPLVLLLVHCRPKEEDIILQFPGRPEVPSSLEQVHGSLLGKIQEMTLFQDSAGRVAVKLEELMQYHFKEEEEYVLPPLGLLPLLASGQQPEQGSNVILLTEKFRSQSAKIYAEHQMIKALMDEMVRADANKSHPEILGFEKELMKHARAEEEVFFPAALLVGDYLKRQSN